MPILKPQIQEALRHAGLAVADKPKDLASELDSAGLSVESTLEVVEGIMVRGGKDTDRLKAAQLALQARGLLKNDNQILAPVINITISDPLRQSTSPLPILIPREVSISTD